VAFEYPVFPNRCGLAPRAIGFASANISDVTLAGASRLTPAVTAMQAALFDTRWRRHCS